LRPDHLWTQPPKHEEPFSTPRSWHMLSDAMKEYGERITNVNGIGAEALEILSYSCHSPHQAGQIKPFIKQIKNRYQLSAIMEGEERWPYKPEDRDILYFLSQSFRAQLIKQLPNEKEVMNEKQKKLTHKAKALIKELASISLEMAQMVVSKQGEDEGLPGWFMVDIVRDLPRLVERKDA